MQFLFGDSIDKIKPVDYDETKYIKKLMNENVDLKDLGEVLFELLKGDELPEYTVFTPTRIITFDTKARYNKFCSIRNRSDPLNQNEWRGSFKATYIQSDMQSFAILLYKTIIRKRGYELIKRESPPTALERDVIKPYFTVYQSYTSKDEQVVDYTFAFHEY